MFTVESICQMSLPELAVRLTIVSASVLPEEPYLFLARGLQLQHARSRKDLERGIQEVAQLAVDLLHHVHRSWNVNARP